MGLSEADKAFFEDNGYLVVPNLLSAQEAVDVQTWVNEVHDWPTDELSPWMPYAEINAQGRHVLSRTENFAASHRELDGLLRGEKLLEILRELSGEDMVLFKEKINYKFAGGGGSVKLQYLRS